MCVNETLDLLVEIGTEELPPTALERLSLAFADAFQKQLEQHQLQYGEIEPFATPRRLALLVRALSAHQPDRDVVRKGPTLRAAFNTQGQPTKAASGFAHSCGVSIDDLQKETFPKGTRLVFRHVQPGRRTADLIIDMTARALELLPIPKRMRWGGTDYQFVRPVHWVAAVLGRQPVKGALFGIQADNSTYGHRFHAPGGISISSPSEYAELLRSQGMVEPSFRRRRELIRKQVQELALEAGGQAVVEENLLKEVTALCEWPSAILGAFDESFLDIPSEVLIETMQRHQKYFPVVSADGGLLPCFITISNIQSSEPSQVRAGNERVIRPRFWDASFFWKQDLKQSLQEFAPKLEKIVFQEKLGTLADRTCRVGRVAERIAGLLGLDKELVARAAYLAKCDLATQMIAEFPSLQGTMGRYYAEKAGEHPCVAAAIEEQYLPRHAGDRLPQSNCGRILSIADKLDTLVGIFAVGQRPTGDKDPYALRRASIGLLRILIETPLVLDFMEILEISAEELENKVDAKGSAVEVFHYSMERLRSYYEDREVAGDVVDAVLAIGPRVPSDLDRRVRAVAAFRDLPEAKALSVANKRIGNILRKSSGAVPANVDVTLLQEDAERRLQEGVAALDSTITPLLETQDYPGALKHLSELRADVDIFFDQVMVMSDDPLLRANRLALLQIVASLFLQVADISLLH
jgi:glycyl-tRNA synthetase beta chain